MLYFNQTDKMVNLSCQLRLGIYRVKFYHGSGDGSIGNASNHFKSRATYLDMI